MTNEQKLAIIFAGLSFLAGLAVVAYGSVLTGAIKASFSILQMMA